MVENGYLIQERSNHDRRTVRVRVSEKGLGICQRITALYERHIGALEEGPIDAEKLEAVNEPLKRLERFWAHDLAYGPRNVLEAVAGAA